MVTDDLVTQGARASAAVAMIYFSLNIPVPAPQGLTLNSSLPCAAYMASVNQVSIGSENGLAPIRRQAII